MLGFVSMSPRFIVGFVGALVIGAGGGYVLGPLAAMEAPPETVGAPRAAPASSRIVVEEVAGRVRAMTPGGSFRALASGDTIERPTVLIAQGRESSVTVSLAGARIRVERDARVLFSAPGPSLQLQLDRGLVLVHSRVVDVSVSVPARDALIRGGAFAVWLRLDRVEASVIDGEISTVVSGASEKYSRGQVVVWGDAHASSFSLPARLEIELERIDRARGGYSVGARTSPHAVAVVRTVSGAEEIEATREGAFAVTLELVPPMEGTLVAYDGVGRSAQVGQPSGSLDDVLASLSKERKPAEGAAGRGAPGGTAPEGEAPEGDRVAEGKRDDGSSRAPEIAPEKSSGDEDPRPEPRGAEAPLPTLSERAAVLLGEKASAGSDSVPAARRGRSAIRRERALGGTRTASSAKGPRAKPKGSGDTSRSTQAGGDGDPPPAAREDAPGGGDKAAPKVDGKTSPESTEGEPPPRPPERSEGGAERELKEIEVE